MATKDKAAGTSDSGNADSAEKFREEMPPSSLDGAQILEWAWSGERPFGIVSGGDEVEAVFGLAIARYEKSEFVYRFSCNASWEVVQDATYASPEEAKKLLPMQYREVLAHWHTI
ncbi:MAG: hypothetical protein V4773_23375 [Verrucomicrobiota bacterium]